MSAFDYEGGHARGGGGTAGPQPTQVEPTPQQRAAHARTVADNLRRHETAVDAALSATESAPSEAHPAARQRAKVAIDALRDIASHAVEFITATDDPVCAVALREASERVAAAEARLAKCALPPNQRESSSPGLAAFATVLPAAGGPRRQEATSVHLDTALDEPETCWAYANDSSSARPR